MAASPLSFRPSWEEFKALKRAQSDLNCSKSALFRVALADLLARFQNEGLVSSGGGVSMHQPRRSVGDQS